MGNCEAAANLPSFWDFPEIKNLVGVGDLRLISFDQAPMGHSIRKPTTVMGNPPGLGQLDGIRSRGIRSDPLPSGLQETMNELGT
jgi:hypothetical protein